MPSGPAPETGHARHDTAEGLSRPRSRPQPNAAIIVGPRYEWARSFWLPARGVSVYGPSL